MTGAPHTVSRCTPAACAGHTGGTGTDNGPNSGVINPNGNFSFAFHGAGTYLYYCQIHGFRVMHATIIIT
jgi:plastocyanin